MIVFVDEKAAFTSVQAHVRSQLLATQIGDQESDPQYLELEWVNRGTESWDDFAAFVFGEDGIEILFAPYHVAPYACGPQFAKLTYEDIFHTLKPVFVAALELEHLVYQHKRLAERSGNA